MGRIAVLAHPPCTSSLSREIKLLESRGRKVGVAQPQTLDGGQGMHVPAVGGCKVWEGTRVQQQLRTWGTPPKGSAV